MGATGVVGGNIPIALGSALAARQKGEDSVAVVFFGDGAVQAGHFNETVNLATLWKLPLVLVCENNGFAEFTPRSAHTNVERVSDVVAPYEVERDTVDGNDVVAVWAAFGRFLEAARAGGGPFLLECLTHRLRGHYEGDPDAYREALADADWQDEGPDPAPPASRDRARMVRRRRVGGRRVRGRRGGRTGRALRAREPVPLGRPDPGDGLRRCLRRRTSRRSPRRSPTPCGPTIASSCSARTSPRAGRTPRPPAWPRSSAPSASSTRRSARLRSRAWRSARRSRACARCSRSCSSTSSLWRSTSSSTGRPRRTSCPAAS